ncbi:hypothetical protein FBU30_009802 [Linnemannia zychae]|nr:hypothetical protein FBU30_009802 [Linnemannia zychae]
MATETVIYVSLALVLLTRIYVFISPPEFLEQHKDRRYHEYHLYRQYHIRKQVDNTNEPDNNTDRQRRIHEDEYDHDLAELLQSHSRRSSSSGGAHENDNRVDGGFVDPSPLTALHYPSDELVLLGMGSGERPLPVNELSTAGFSKIENLSIRTNATITSTESSKPFSSMFASPVTTPTSATMTAPTTVSSSPYSPRNGDEQDVWSQILGTGKIEVEVPSYLSLDISEIHYNGPLHRFEKDNEVQETIRALKAGQRDMTKECPVMTVLWEGGRWCCLEGRTLYILRSMEWKGQVRVRVLVDKDPTTLAVTEECWKAAGMTSDLTPLFATLGRKVSAPATVSPTSAETNEDGLGNNNGNRVYMSTAMVDPGTMTIGLSLDDSTFGNRVLIGTPEVESNVRSSLSRSNSRKRSSPSGSYSGNDADVEEVERDDESRPVSDDGYMEDDEGGIEEDGEGDDSEDESHRYQQYDIHTRLRSMSLQNTHRPHYYHHLSKPSSQRLRQPSPTKMGAILQQDESENNSDLTMVSPPSPVFTPLSSIAQLQSDPSILSGGGGNVKKAPYRPRAVSTPHSHHERKISIPEFMLPPPLHDEQVYLIVDPAVGITAGRKADAGLVREIIPPRRDSGQGDSS